MFAWTLFWWSVISRFNSVESEVLTLCSDLVRLSNFYRAFPENTHGIPQVVSVYPLIRLPRTRPVLCFSAYLNALCVPTMFFDQSCGVLNIFMFARTFLGRSWVGFFEGSLVDFFLGGKGIIGFLGDNETLLKFVCPKWLQIMTMKWRLLVQL